MMKPTSFVIKLTQSTNTNSPSDGSNERAVEKMITNESSTDLMAPILPASTIDVSLISLLQSPLPVGNSFFFFLPFFCFFFNIMIIILKWKFF